MTRRTCAVMSTLLFLALTVPALGKNYSLHSPKLWTPQEKEQYERENPPVVSEKELAEKQKERLKKEKEQAEKLKEQAKKEKELADKQKEQLKKEKEQAEKQKELVKKEKDQIEKQKELIIKEKMQVEKEREQVKIEKEQVEKQREQVKREKEKVKKENEQIKKNQILVKDGVSYREVTVQKGDSLYTISRKYSKEGSSYAETLRFNDIQDPDQIVSGDIIKVPLFQEKKTKQPATAKQLKLPAALPKQRTTASIADKAVRESPLSYLKDTAAGKKGLPVKTIISSPLSSSTAPAKACIPQQLAFSNNSSSGPKLFEQAVKSYRSGDCQIAIQLFGRYLSEQSTSALAADASLFIADCYLKLSGK
ncbi:MAG: LysM peptidoglycan-binding domain-containing protein [Geobacteraceae bacterium]|nr:LysM peptidoglycan-binding domain-containing protein [Geobacteraceae bacterium]NTW80799.1 LysM peptidoglycan-binding domain-containing protein [Geobacteraceae bacterium]